MESEHSQSTARMLGWGSFGVCSPGNLLSRVRLQVWAIMFAVDSTQALKIVKPQDRVSNYK